MARGGSAEEAADPVEQAVEAAAQGDERDDAADRDDPDDEPVLREALALIAARPKKAKKK